MASVDSASPARARSDVYRFLAGLFIERPSEEAVAELLRSETLDELAHAYGEGAVEGLQGLAPEALDAGAEFDRLFLIPAEGFVPACESVYKDPNPDARRREGHLYGPSCRAAADLMREAGATMPSEVGQPPDHIGVELLFLSYLCGQEAEARHSGDTDRLERWLGRELRFLRDHPATWVGTFRERVEKSAPGAFFSGVTRLVESVLTTDLHFLGGG
jgi:TorA maturation chaperone TorD